MRRHRTILLLWPFIVGFFFLLYSTFKNNDNNGRTSEQRSFVKLQQDKGGGNVDDDDVGELSLEFAKRRQHLKEFCQQNNWKDRFIVEPEYLYNNSASRSIFCV